MTKLENQDTPLGVSVFRRSRRAAAAIAFSLGVGSLAYGTVLSLPASAQTAATAGASCTASASPTDTVSGTATPTGTATGDDGTAAAGATDSAASPAGSDASQGADATGSASATGSPTPTATGTGTGETCATASGSPTSGTSSASTLPASLTPSATATTKPASATPSKSRTTIAGKGSPTAKPPTARNSSVQVYVVAPTDTSSYFAYTAVPPGDADYQLPHGTISRAQIMARAALWVQEQVPYSQTEWYTNQNGTYRQDCSGYVSMAWDLNQNTDFWTGNLNLVSRTIGAAQLLPGDILLSDEHTILFAGWADAAHTSFDYYEEAHPGTVARYVVDAPLAAFLDNGFAPFRYDGVVGSGALPANPASGDPYAMLAQQGSEIDPSGVATGPLPGLSATKRVAVQAAADVSAAGGESGGMALGVGGAFLLCAGLLMRRPMMQERRRRH